MGLKVTTPNDLFKLNKWGADIETRLSQLEVTSTQGRQGIDPNKAGPSFKHKGTYQQAVGGGRAHAALDANNRLVNTKRLTAVNSSYTPTTSVLAQSGATTTINIGASTQQFPDGSVSYNSGSVNPGALGTYYIYADDPLYAGGAVVYVATTTNYTVTANDGRLYFGKITTTGGGGATGAGGGNGAVHLS